MNILASLLAPYFFEKKIEIVDIGSLGGVKAPWSDIRSLIRIIGFEPQDRITQTKRGELGDLYGSVAIGEQDGQAEFYTTQKTDNSSLAMPNYAFTQRLAVRDRYVVTKKEKVQVMSLDEWLALESVRNVDFLKIDTQGTEGAVLSGATRSLESVLGLDVEVNFAERYEGQSYFSDIDENLRAKGFALFDLQRRYFKYARGVRYGGPKGQLTHGTALYFRSLDSFREMLSHCEKKESERLLAKFILIITLYGYYDYALEILSECTDVFPSKIENDLRLTINSQTSLSERLPRFSFRFGVARILESLARAVRPYSRFGTFGDDSLGNL